MQSLDPQTLPLYAIEMRFIHHGYTVEESFDKCLDDKLNQHLDHTTMMLQGDHFKHQERQAIMEVAIPRNSRCVTIVCYFIHSPFSRGGIECTLNYYIKPAKLFSRWISHTARYLICDSIGTCNTLHQNILSPRNSASHILKNHHPCAYNHASLKCHRIAHTYTNSFTVYTHLLI